MRSTIDFGIHLGTNNCAVAVLEGTEPRIIKNVYQVDRTPCAVWMSPNGVLTVGNSAKAKAGRDSDNVFTGFRRAMGTAQEFRFARDGRVMRAEDLSAELLKALRADIERATGEVPSAVVISVPAAFGQPQCAITKLAAQKAGFKQSPLLQEPVAVSLAYGFQDASENVFWLIYDLGGRTFDATVVTMRDGVFQVVNQLEDNHIAGTDIDRTIVDDLLLPALAEEYGVVLDRASPRWNGALTALEYSAEEARIALSQLNEATIQVEELRDNRRNVVAEDFIFDLSRHDLERLMEPRLERTLDLCRKVLAEKGLDADDLEKVILVGGPTLAPYVRQRLCELGDGVAGRLEFRIDPLTVVARGAAVFAGTQRLETSAARAALPGVYQARLEYRAISADTEPLVGGVVEAPHGGDLAGFSIEFLNLGPMPPWRSGKIALAPNGAFMTNLWAERGRTSTFTIELADDRGEPRTLEPNSLTYTVGGVFSGVPLPHGVGITLPDNDVAWFFRKGDTLPARKRMTIHTSYSLHAGGALLLRIPLIEGLSERADRNAECGAISICEADLTQDVPEGSEVEATLEIDEFRSVRAEVYIPLLDEAFEATYDYATYREKARDPAHFADQIHKEKARLDELRERAEESGDAGVREALRQVDHERLVQEVEEAAVEMAADWSAANRCEKRLRDLQQALDEAESSLRWPALLADAEDAIRLGQRVIDDFGEADDEGLFALLCDHVREAMRLSDEALLEQRVEALRGFARGISSR